MKKNKIKTRDWLQVAKRAKCVGSGLTACGKPLRGMRKARPRLFLQLGACPLSEFIWGLSRSVISLWTVPIKLAHKRVTNSGFTLIEVLVALAIAALTLTAILQLSLSSARLTSRVSREFNALPVAVEQIEELKNKTILLDSVKDVKDYTVKSKIETESCQDLDYNTLKLEVFDKDELLAQLYWFDLKEIKTKEKK